MCTAILLGGCTGGTDQSDDSALDTVRPSVSSANRLALNRLALNRLALNSMTLGRLAGDELDESRWQLADDSELLATEAGREVLAYVVKCALDPDDVVVGTLDGQTYELRGLLGLTPAWKVRSLHDDEQELISACLLAHVNAFGTPVTISLRAEGTLSATDEERRDYPVYEGAFFGQLFEDDEIRAYSCQGSQQEAALAHSEDRALRVCTNESESCDIISVGRCRDVCETRTKDMGWNDCWAEGRRYQPTVNVYLFADDRYARNQRCTSRDCNLETGSGAAAILDCNGRHRCTAACNNGATCTIDGLDSQYVKVAVSGARMSEIDCYDSHDCAVDCSNGSRCDVECQAGKSCDVSCSGGAHCDVDCYRSERCDMVCRDGAVCHVQSGGSSTKKPNLPSGPA